MLYLDILTAHNLGQTPENISERVVLFPSLKNEWPALKPISGYDDAVHTFKLGNTQLQRAAKIYVLDGYVTDYVRIQQAVSKLYK